MNAMRLSFVLVVLLALGVSGPATAADEPAASDAATVAAQFFRAGRAAYDRKEYRAAALAFLEAYRRVPRAAAMYNAGRAWDAAGELDLAADAFTQAFDEELNAADATHARTRLDAIRASLGIVYVRAPTGAEVIVRGVDRGTVPATVHLAPGTHEVHVRRRDGSDVAKSVTIERPGERIEVAFDDVAAPVPSQTPAPPPRTPAPPPPSPPPDRSPPVVAWALVAGAGALAIGGAYTYARFADARSTFESGGSHGNSLHDDALRWRTWTYALWGGAAALGITGGVLFYLQPRAPASSATVTVGPRGVAFTLMR